MKTLLPITIPHSSRITIHRGDKIASGDKIARNTSETVKEKVPLSSILNVNPKKINRFLVVKLGGSIKKGQVLAKKSSLFKNIQVLSPFDGVVESIDLKAGTCLLSSLRINETNEYSPVDGVVEEINHNRITVSFDGMVIEAQNGRGDKVTGEVLVFDDDADMLDFQAEVAEKVVICKSLSDSALAKLEALNAKALVTTGDYQGLLSYVRLTIENYNNLLKKLKKQLIVLPESKKIIIPL